MSEMERRPGERPIQCGFKNGQFYVIFASTDPETGKKITRYVKAEEQENG